MNNNPYFKFIKKDFMIVFLLFATIISVNLFGTVIADIIETFKGVSSEPIRIFSQAAQMSTILCAVYGSVEILKSFNGAMSIRGDRVGFLKAFAKWGIILAISVSVFSLTLELGSKFIAEVVTGREVYLISDITWVSLDEVELNPTEVSGAWFFSSILTRIISNIMMISVGYMIGAIIYRLKVKYNVILFVILPLVFGGYIVNYAIRDEEGLMYIVMNVLTFILYIIEKPIILICIQTIIFGVCTLL
ncbi:MAG: hypothetical protein ACRDD7_00560 [Peptostreptococcaceae bacterium]